MADFIFIPEVKKIETVEDFKLRLLTDLSRNKIEDYFMYVGALDLPKNNFRYFYDLGSEFGKQGLIKIDNELNIYGGGLIKEYVKRKAEITLKGIEHLASIEMNKLMERQAELNIAANKSVIETNNSILALNEETKKNYIIQKRSLFWAYGIGAFSTIFIGITTYLSFVDTTAKSMRELQQQVQKQSQTLQRIDTSLRLINSSIETIKNDSLHR